MAFISILSLQGKNRGCNLAVLSEQVQYFLQDLRGGMSYALGIYGQSYLQNTLPSSANATSLVKR